MNVEWVGDMTESSSPDFLAIQDTPVHRLSVGRGNNIGTAKSDLLRNGADERNRVPIRPFRDIPSQDSRKKNPSVHIHRSSGASSRSALRVHKARGKPRQPLRRPRVVAETFQSPPPSPNSPSGSSDSRLVVADHVIQEHVKWPQAPRMQGAPHTRQSYPPPTSSSSPEGPELSRQEWFTPRSARRAEHKASLKGKESSTRNYGVSLPESAPYYSTTAEPERSSNYGGSETFLSISDSWPIKNTQGIYGNIQDSNIVPKESAKNARRISAAKGEAPFERRNGRTTWPSKSMEHNSPQGYVDTAASRRSSLDELYFRRPSQPNKSYSENTADHDVNQESSLATYHDIHRYQSTIAELERADSPSSIYSRSISGVRRVLDRESQLDGDGDEFFSMHSQNQASLYAPDSQSPTGPSPPYTRSSRVHSYRRETEGATMQARGRYGKRAATANQADNSASEIARLKEDQTALRHDMAALRREFQALKAVLLKSKV